MTKCLAGALLIFALTGCDSWMRSIEHSYHWSLYSKLDSYHGIMSESGETAEDMTVSSEVWFVKPSKFASRILAPESLRGTSLTYDGTILEFYNPADKIAIRYKNLKPLSVEDAPKFLESNPMAGMNVQLERGVKSKVAGFITEELRYTGSPQKRKTAISSGTTDIYHRFYLPLSGEMSFQNGARYQWMFDEIHFNDQTADKALVTPSLPEGTPIVESDLGAAPVPKDDLQSQIPSRLPSGIRYQGAVPITGPYKGFTLTYETGPHFLLITVFERPDVHIVPAALGIRLKPGGRASLVPGSVLRIFSFTAHQHRYLAVGNIPYPELISSAGFFGGLN